MIWLFFDGSLGGSLYKVSVRYLNKKYINGSVEDLDDEVINMDFAMILSMSGFSGFKLRCQRTSPQHNKNCRCWR